MPDARQQVDFVALDEEMKFLPNRHFALSASTITFRDPGQVLLVRNTKYNEAFYTLPGGRKDIGEGLEETAVRETYEETGYRVRLPSVSILTRATRPRVADRRRRKGGPVWDATFAPTAFPPVHTSTLASAAASTPKDIIADCGTEPVGMITYNDPLAEGSSTKYRFFFYATLRDANLPPDAPMLDQEERLQAEWMTVAEALHHLRFEAEKQVVETANALKMAGALQEGVKDNGEVQVQAEGNKRRGSVGF